MEPPKIEVHYHDHNHSPPPGVLEVALTIIIGAFCLWVMWAH